MNPLNNSLYLLMSALVFSVSGIGGFQRYVSNLNWIGVDIKSEDSIIPSNFHLMSGSTPRG